MSFANPPTYLIVYRWQSKTFSLPKAFGIIPFHTDATARLCIMIPQTIIRIMWGVIARHLSEPGWFEFRTAPAYRAPNISHIGSLTSMPKACGQCWNISAIMACSTQRCKREP
ncbi:hypothetical protein CDAR_512681 [Caerostris darwini]|uniref:Uncharacterized protein n=1 Tax=Caerostris darwini TaxID=1538125 RepID=A0AAV4S6K5_9ARAC|nr:hypothetical protein CDAR_512681 [Caerostris darwini]